MATITSGSLSSWDYIASYGDLRNWALQDHVLNATDSANAAWHYNTYVATGIENRTISFNAYDYLASNVDLINWLGADGITDGDFITAAQHYIQYGVNEGRTITFDAAAYFAANPDLVGYAKWLGVNNDEAAAIHYITSGRFEIAAGVAGRSAVGTPLLVGKNFTLTAGADISPAFAGTSGNDTYVATRDTLTAGDNLVGNGGADTLFYSDNTAVGAAYKGAFELHGIEAVKVTMDNAGSVGFDFSGSDGIKTVESYNSTGSVLFDQLTALVDVKVTNVTHTADVQVHFQDSVVAGAADAVNLILGNNYNISPIGNIQIGSVTAANGGVETLNVTVAGHAATVTTLDSNITTLNVADGDAAGLHDLTILTALNPTIQTVDAHTFTGALQIDLRGDNNNLTVTTGTGNDVIHLDGVLGNDHVITGKGNDTVYLGFGHDTVDLGDGKDTLYIVPNVLTVDDTITGGANVDTIILTGSDNISKSEAEHVTAVEVLELDGKGANFDGVGNGFTPLLGSNIVITDNLLTTISAGSDRFTVDSTHYSGSNTIDITNVTFSNTNKFDLEASNTVANNELVIANDATVNAKAVLNYGAGSGDTLRVIDGANITADDLSNITGLERIELQSASNLPQTWDLELTNALVSSSSTKTLDIWVDSDVPAGTQLVIDASALTLAGVTIHHNSNVTVTGNLGIVTLVNSLYYTYNADTLVGGSGSDLFVADYLGQVQTADSVNGNGGSDTLQLNFGVYNENIGLFGVGGQLNHTGIASIENVVFNTKQINQQNQNVAFTDDATDANGVVSYTTQAGNDVVYHNIFDRTVTYNLGDGDNTFYDWLAGDVSASNNNDLSTVITGKGNDHVYTDNDQSRGGVLDHVHGTFNLGAGTDTLHINARLDSTIGDTVAHGSDYNLSGVDVIEFNSIGSGATTTGLLIQDSAVTQTDAGNLLTIHAKDNNGIANTTAIVDGAHFVVVTGHSLVIDVTTTGADTGIVGVVVGDLADHAVDVFGGAGKDTITIGAGLSSYTVQGNAGEDTINIVTTAATGVKFNSQNDGGTNGVSAGYDHINGFTSGVDQILFNHAAFAATDHVGTGVGFNLVTKFDVAVDFTSATGQDNALVLTQIGTGMTDNQIVDFATVAAWATTDTIVAGAGDGGIIIAHGQTHSAIYHYIEQGGDNIVQTTELKLLGLVDSSSLGNAAGDLHYV